MRQANDQASVEWFIRAIDALPSDNPVPLGTPGYNKYTTQKAHWLGWLNPAAKTGTYPRASGNERGARNVYNRIVEPKMLLWLISASGVRKDLIESARLAAAIDAPMPTRAAAVRKHVPWEEAQAALSKRMRAE
ncbi:MAG: hypothetical protein Q8K25_02775 [Hydrogenophaga sp.]|nr:hypothetical protein [Hydrogenophaga sp.]MDP3110445.1 hypothetical protein [Hydrogenophaga sp.]